jgi:MinD-like ATPase involved in chromosome partitioning or flagellar assembly
MLFACWSVKGGSGTTVVAAALALLLTDSSHVLLVDASGDLPAVLGVPDVDGPGLADWLAADEVAPDALGRLMVDAAPGLQLLPWRGGPAPPPGVDADRLLAALATEHRPVVVDCGSTGSPFALGLAASASMSLLVLRPCFLALRRALAAPVRPSGVILVAEPGRALTRHDVEDVLNVPVRAELAWCEAVARAVDGGLSRSRLPRSLVKTLKEAA